MPWIAGAAILGGAVLNSMSSSDAADAQLQSGQNSINANREMYNQNRSDLKPYRTAGVNALNALQYGLGLTPEASSLDASNASASSAEARQWRQEQIRANPGGFWDTGPDGTQFFNTTGVDPAGTGGIGSAPAGSTGTNAGFGYGDLNRNFSLADFEADPGYNFRMGEGLKAVQNSAAAKGGLLSGNALKAITRFGQDLGTQEYGNAYARFNQNQSNQFNRLSSLTGLGANAAGQTAGLGAAAGTNIGNTITGMGNVAASGIVGGANAISSGIGGAVNNYNQAQLVNALRGSGYGNTGNSNTGQWDFLGG